MHFPYISQFEIFSYSWIWGCFCFSSLSDETCKQGWYFSINILSKLSLLPLLVPLGCSWLLRSQTGGLLWCKFTTLSLLLSSQRGVGRKPELWVASVNRNIYLCGNSFHAWWSCCSLLGVFIHIYLAQSLLQDKWVILRLLPGAIAWHMEEITPWSQEGFLWCSPSLNPRSLQYHCFQKLLILGIASHRIRHQLRMQPSSLTYPGPS